MTNEELINMVQEDLKNERKHLAFYTQAAVMMKGLHREELREFCETEAKGELEHVTEFSELIVQLGGIPGTDVNDFPSGLGCPVAILKYVVEMENEVAEKYAQRLRETEDMKNANTAYVHLFYEDQLQDSWKTAKEVEQMVVQYEHKDSCSKD